MNTKSFKEYLASKKGQKIYFDPCSGNNGDDLIWMGMQVVVDEVKPIIVSIPDDADLIVVNGGGMFIDQYKQGINKIVEYTSKYPAVELCIAPNSFDFKTIDFRKYLEDVPGRLVIFCRENFSLQYMVSTSEGLDNIEICNDSDLAFNLGESDWLQQLKKQQTEEVVLIVDRMDAESGRSKSPKKILLVKIYSKAVPLFVKIWLTKVRVWLKGRGKSDFSQQCKELSDERLPGTRNLPIIVKDISRPDICSFDEFVSLINSSAVVHTNRLHVGLLAALIGKKTFLYEGSYHKLTGIYQMSMQQMGHVTLVKSWNG